MSEIVHIAFAADGNYTRQLFVVMASLLKSCRGTSVELHIHVLDCGIADDDWADVGERTNALSIRYDVRCSIARHIIDMSLFSGFRIWNSSRATYARLMLASLLPGVRYCVYSDCDMLFFKNPAVLVDELKKAGVAILGRRNTKERDGVSLDERWFLDKGEPYNSDTYFCAGLIAMDLDKFRVPGALEAMFDFLARHPDVVSADQTALNWFFRNDSALADDGWGLSPMECFGDVKNIYAIHYHGGSPWKDINSWYRYFVSRRIDSVWIEFARKMGVMGMERRTSAYAQALGEIAILATRVILALRIPIPGRGEFLKEAYDILYKHLALDQAKAMLVNMN